MLPTDLLLDLTRRYCEPHRRYHNLEHVAELLWRGRELPLSDEQVLAIWYHDAVYAVPGENNEADSAALAVSQLTQAGLEPARVAVVERIVLDTRNHLPSIPQSGLVIDLDLSPLAAPWERFLHNNHNIRAEYGCFDDAAFAHGQRAVFDRFLQRERIFVSAWGAAMEAVARANLQRARAALAPP
jgi:predicted metal-dependent HD superfamily phosphohydrolase